VVPLMKRARQGDVTPLAAQRLPYGDRTRYLRFSPHGASPASSFHPMPASSHAASLSSPSHHGADNGMMPLSTLLQSPTRSSRGQATNGLGTLPLSVLGSPMRTLAVFPHGARGVLHPPSLSALCLDASELHDLDRGVRSPAQLVAAPPLESENIPAPQSPLGLLGGVDPCDQQPQRVLELDCELHAPQSFSPSLRSHSSQKVPHDLVDHTASGIRSPAELLIDRTLDSESIHPPPFSGSRVLEQLAPPGPLDSPGRVCRPPQLPTLSRCDLPLSPERPEPARLHLDPMIAQAPHVSPGLGKAMSDLNPPSREHHSPDNHMHDTGAQGAETREQSPLVADEGATANSEDDLDSVYRLYGISSSSSDDEVLDDLQSSSSDDELELFEVSRPQHVQAPRSSRSTVLCVCGCGKPYTKPGSVLYYKEHLDAPLYPGATINTVDMIYALLVSKQHGLIPRSSFDTYCKFLHTKALPQPNFLPPSSHLMTQVITVDDWSMHEVHVCGNEKCKGFRWPKLGRCSPSVLERHKDDKCPICGTPRFSVEHTEGGKVVIKPNAFCIDFGLKTVLQDMFGDKDFANDVLTRERASEPEVVGTYHDSYECRRLERELKKKDAQSSMRDLHNVRFDILADWLQPWGSVAYSVGIISLRCCDVSPRNLGKTGSSRIVIIIPGPKMPKSIRPYIMGLLQEFSQAFVSKIELRVNLPNQPTVQIRPLLTGFLADSPARIKYAEWMGVGARLGACGWCMNEGVPYRHGTSNKVTYYYYGYHEPRPQILAFGGVEMKVGDPRLRLSHDAQMLRAQEVEGRIKAANTAGCHGVSIVCSTLPYTDYNNVWVVPVAHALLYGVAKDFVAHLLRAPGLSESMGAKNLPQGADFISLEDRRTMRERVKYVHVTSDFGRRYKCIVQYMNSYKLEDWLHFVEVFGFAIFRGILSTQMAELWGCIVEAVDGFMRPSSFENRDQYTAACNKAAGAIARYAKTIEYYEFPAQMFTFNLHMLVCRLGTQVLVRGHSSRELEFVVEREVQVFKQAMGRRVCVDPEKTFSNNVLLDMRLRAILVERPGLKTMEQHCEPAIQASARPPAYDMPSQTIGEAGTDEDRALLLDKGKRVRDAAQRTRLLDLAKLVIQTEGHDVEGWSVSDIEACKQIASSHERYPYVVMTYTKAECNEDHITAYGHGAGQGRRVNHWVQVNYTNDRGVDEPHVCMVKLFVRVHHPLSDDQPIRFAVCDVYEPLPTEQDGRVLKARQGRAKWLDYPVLIKNIEAKLVAFLPPRPSESLFVKPLNMTTRA
jgi:hypothetical protein